MALGRILAASAAGFATLHHALEKRPFAEVLQLLKFPLQISKALRVAIQDSGRLGSSMCAHNRLDNNSFLR
jgi:hypothetical protein